MGLNILEVICLLDLLIYPVERDYQDQELVFIYLSNKGIHSPVPKAVL